jgi:hypothetical protein
VPCRAAQRKGLQGGAYEGWPWYDTTFNRETGLQVLVLMSEFKKIFRWQTAHLKEQQQHD